MAYAPASIDNKLEKSSASNSVTYKENVSNSPLTVSKKYVDHRKSIAANPYTLIIDISNHQIPSAGRREDA